jgi:TolB-like protein/Tfp pilus assembly protein PilF
MSEELRSALEQSVSPTTFNIGPFRLDPGGAVLYRGSDPLPVGRRAVALLIALAKRQGLLVSKDELIEAAWSGLAVEESNLTVQIAALRRALSIEPGAGQWIETMPRRGYRFTGPVALADASDATATGRRLTVPDRPSIAVLPFANMSGDREQEYLVDGITEEIITALSKWPSLLVIARNSTFTYKGRSVDLRQVGHELGVRYVLEGSVRKAGGRLRITGQLIEAATRTHLWADRFEGPLEDVFELQDRVTEQVVGTIAPKLEQAEIAQSKRKTKNLLAYDYYLRGLDRFNAGTAEANSEASELFENTIKLDPAFARAHAMAALCYGVRRASGWPLGQAGIERAFELANKAVEIDKFDAQTLSCAGFVLMHLAGEFERGAALTREAVRLNPNYSRAWLWYGFTNLWIGEHASAKDCFERSIRLNPYEPYDFLAPLGIGWTLIMLEEYDEAWAWVQRAKRLGPKFLAASEAEILCLVRFGQVEEARQRFDALAKIDRALESAAVYRARSRFRRRTDLDRLVEALHVAGLKG